MMDEIKELKNEILELKHKRDDFGLASELLSDKKKEAKRLFIIWIITFLALICLGIYTIKLLNDIGTIETIQEIEDVDTIGGNIVNSGDIYGEN